MLDGTNWVIISLWNMVIYMNNKEEQIIFGMIKMDLYILVTMVMFQQILSVEK